MSFWQQFLDWLRSLFSETPPPPPEPQGGVPVPVTRKAAVITFDPTVPAAGGQHLTRVLGWEDVDTLVNGYISDLRSVSGGYLNYQAVEHIAVDAFPFKLDGFRYTVDDYLSCWQSGSGFHQPDLVDYQRILDDYGLVARVNSGQLDELWLFGMPYAGFYESIMGGPGAFFCNAPPLPVNGADRRFVIMGFNYQRGVGEMLEAFGHRAESILRQVYRNTPPEDNLWERFTRYDQSHPGQAECGTVHFAPNSTRDYEWGRAVRVPTRCRNWSYFPDFSGEPLMLDCAEWGGGDIRLHHLWWLGLFPRITGQHHGIPYNWWQAVVDPNLAD